MRDWGLAAAFAVALVISWIATGRLASYLRQRGVVDTPNTRSSHTVPTPRGGGLGILAGLAAGVLAASLLGERLPSPFYFLALAAVAAVGFWDDSSAGGLGAGRRLILQICAAAAAIAATGPLPRFPLPPPLDAPLGALAWPLTVVWVLAILNFYNFLDGIDGYAGLQGVIAGAGLLLLPLPDPVRAVAAALAGGCLGFLRHNWHPARIFMGDAGSTSIGFLVATLPLCAEEPRRPVFALAAGLLVFFFLADGVFTLSRRLMRGERIWEAHRSHLYQRWVQSGLTHSQVCVRAGVFMTIVAVSTLLCIGRPDALAWLPFALAFLLFGLYWYAVAGREKLKAESIRQGEEIAE